MPKWLRIKLTLKIFKFFWKKNNSYVENRGGWVGDFTQLVANLFQSDINASPPLKYTRAVY